MFAYLFYDVCAALVLFTLILALIGRRLIKGRSNQLFLRLCVAIFITTLLDVATEYLDNAVGIGEYYTMLRYFLDTMYFIIYNICTPLCCVYLCSILGLWYKIKKRMMMFYFLVIPYGVAFILIVANLFTGCIFSITNDFKYVHGPLFNVLYSIAFYYIVLMINVMFYNRKLLPKIKFYVIIFCLFVILTSLGLQIIFPEYRIAMFMESLVMVGVAFFVHRPEEVMDYVVGIQSHSSFLAEVKKNFTADSPSAYLFIRFDNYQGLHKTLGLENLLELLKMYAGRLERLCKASALGYELFYLEEGAYAIVVSDDEYEELYDVGRTVMAYMQEPVILRHMEVAYSAKMVIVRCPKDIGKEENLLNFASTFQYKLPDEKKVFSIPQIASNREFRILNEMDTIIKRGIENQYFEMYYQPIFSISEQKYVSAEALIRLKDPQYGFISPGIFIPAAEASGAIHDIGDFVIDEVCKFIGKTDFEAYGLEYIEINLSAAQLIEVNVCEKMQAAMNKYKVNPSQLNLEITETAADYDPAVTDTSIEKLRRCGLTFSLDDYGTGYSNIMRVISLPLDIVKLDKSLVDDMDSPQMWTFIRNTVTMLKRMKKKILVEGIEDARAMYRFTDIGCDYIQGFYFSKPLPEKDFLEFVKEHNK